MKTSENSTPLPTSTTHAIRLCLFQATRRPQVLKRETILTPWGKIKISGKLGQQHADVLEAICYEREKKGSTEDGRIKLLVDPARVRRRANQVSGSSFDHVLEELQQAVIQIIEPTKLACSGHLIDHIDKALRSDGTHIVRDNPLGGQRHLWRVEIGKAFCKLVSGDIWLGYDPARLARLDHGISQAVARHVLSHRAQPVGGWHVDTLIEAVTAGAVRAGSTAIRDRRRELHRDAPALLDSGILIEAGRLLKVDAAKPLKPDSVEHKPDSVEHKPDSVEHKPDSVEHKPDFSRYMFSTFQVHEQAPGSAFWAARRAQ